MPFSLSLQAMLLVLVLPGCLTVPLASTHGMPDLFSRFSPASAAQGWTLPDIDALPPGLALPLREAMQRCRSALPAGENSLVVRGLWPRPHEKDACMPQCLCQQAGDMYYLLMLLSSPIHFANEAKLKHMPVCRRMCVYLFPPSCVCIHPCHGA